MFCVLCYVHVVTVYTRIRIRVGIWYTIMMMVYNPERHLPTSGQHGPTPSGTHRRWHSRPHHRRHGKHSPTARQPQSNGLCSPPKEGPGPGSSAITHTTRHDTTRIYTHSHTYTYYYLVCVRVCACNAIIMCTSCVVSCASYACVLGFLKCKFLYRRQCDAVCAVCVSCVFVVVIVCVMSSIVMCVRVR